MEYHLLALTSVAQCDSLLIMKNGDRTRLALRISDQKSRAIANAATATMLPVRMSALEVEIDAKQQEISNATDPMKQIQLQIERNNLENERFRIILRLQYFDSRKLALQQLSIGRMEHEMNAFDELITALGAARRNFLRRVDRQRRKMVCRCQD